MSASATTLIAASYQKLNVFLAGEAPDANSNALAFGELNRMMGSWAQQRGTIPAVSREVFDVVANQGGPSNPYTIGTGGNFNTTRPPNQASLVGAGLLLTSPTPDVEIPLTIYTDDGWQAIQIKELTSAQPTGVYYQPTYAGGLGTINLWPVPDTAINDLVLYMLKRLAAFANLTTVYDFPDGYEDALVYNLALRLQTPTGRKAEQEVKDQARESLALLKRVNLPIMDVASDLMVSNHAGWYNIETGTGG